MYVPGASLEHEAVCKSYSIHICLFHADIEWESIAGTRSTFQITTCTHRTNCAISMFLGHLSILLGHYGAFCVHMYRGHAAGTKSQLTETIKHSSGNFQHVPGTCSSGKLLFRSREEGCSGRLYRTRAAGTTSNCAHTFANAAITCPGDMKPQSNPVSYIGEEM